MSTKKTGKKPRLSRRQAADLLTASLRATLASVDVASLLAAGNIPVTKHNLRQFDAALQQINQAMTALVTPASPPIDIKEIKL